LKTETATETKELGTVPKTETEKPEGNTALIKPSKSFVSHSPKKRAKKAFP
jgi:hypothetical protein